MKCRFCAKFEVLVPFVTFLAVFGSTADSGPNAVPAEPNSPAEAVLKTSIAVTVNGVDITESEVDAEVARRLRGAKMPPQFIEQYKKQIRQPALEDLISRVLVDERIRAEVVVTEEEVIAYLERAGAAQKPPLSLDDIKERIRAAGQNFDEVKRDIRRRLGSQKLMEAQWAGRINITEDDARKYYDENPRLFETPEQVRASHILIKPDTSDPNTDPNEAKAKAKAKAHELLRQIQNAADFATLAKANSACPSAEYGGDLGLKPKGTWVKPFEEAAFKLKVGQVSDVVETQFGYHIIKLTDRKEPTITTFDQARDGIINALTREKRREITREYVKSLMAKANIVYPPGKGPKASTPVIKPPKPPPTDSNATAKPEDKNAVK